MIHRVQIFDDDKRPYWECDCGMGGSVSVNSRIDVEEHSEKHIDYDNGDTKVNVHKSEW